MKWCRLYKDFASDAKIQALPHSYQRHFIMLMCLHINDEIKDLDEDQIRKYLGVRKKEFLKIKEIFLQMNFISVHWELIQWSEKQFLSDDARPRVSRLRQKMNEKCNSLLPLQDRYKAVTVTAPDTDTDTDTDTDVLVGSAVKSERTGVSDLLNALACYFPAMSFHGYVNTNVLYMLKNWNEAGVIVMDVEEAIESVKNRDGDVKAVMYYKNLVLELCKFRQRDGNYDAYRKKNQKKLSIAEQNEITLREAVKNFEERCRLEDLENASK